MVENATSRIQKETLVSQVCDYVTSRIESCLLKPGQRIDIGHLSQELAVSQTPIREALHRLKEQDLVTVKPYVGYFVMKLTWQDIQQLFELREVIEVLALKYIMDDHDKEAIEELRRKATRLEQVADCRDMTQQVREFDEESHVSLLIRGSHNKWLAKLGNRVIGLFKLTTKLSLNPRVACVEHLAILEAIAGRDLDKATSLLQSHIRRAKQDSLQTLGGDLSEDRY